MSTCVLPTGLPPRTTHDSFYLGQPGAMVKVGMPDSGFSNGGSRAEVAHALSSGGVTTTKRRLIKRTWSLPFSGMTADTADALLSYYSGSRGNGPYALVDPSWRNALSLDASTFGAALGQNTTWAAPPADAQPYLDTAFAPPIPGSAVLHWPTPVNTHLLVNASQPALAAPVPDWMNGVPYLNDLPMVFSVWIRTVTGSVTGLVLGALGLQQSGWITPFPEVAVSLPTVNTTWQQVSVLVNPNAWTQAQGGIFAPAIGAVPATPDLLIACAQVTYGFTVATPWVTGLGCPRVSFSAGVSSGVSVNWRRDHGYMLSEV